LIGNYDNNNNNYYYNNNYYNNNDYDDDIFVDYENDNVDDAVG